MSDCFTWKLFDKTFKIKSKKKHQKVQYHQALTKSIISRYYITNQIFLDVEDIQQKQIL